MNQPTRQSPRPSGSWHVGDTSITRIDELTMDGFGLTQLLPDAEPGQLARCRDRLEPDSLRAGTDKLVVSTHTWLLRTPRHVILIDTATGNNKHRPTVPVLDQLDQPYLARLAAAGVRPEDVDIVLITHLHSDHVGWNTRLQDGRWVPTFPRARYIFSKNEQSDCAAVADGQEPRTPPALGPRVLSPMRGLYQDSVRPVLDAGLAELVDPAAATLPDGLSFVPTPGHSLDHASIRLVSNGQEALFAGDVLHHPLQVREPQLNSCFCEFPEAAIITRRAVLADAATRKALIFTTHFAESSAGRVGHGSFGHEWRFEAPHQDASG